MTKTQTPIKIPKPKVPEVSKQSKKNKKEDKHPVTEKPNPVKEQVTTSNEKLVFSKSSSISNSVSNKSSIRSRSKTTNSLNNTSKACNLSSITGSSESSDDVEEHDISDIEIMELASPEELFQLIITDPEYYFKLLENNENLQHKFRIILKRNTNDTLNVKFRILPNDRWSEIGYFQEMSDKEVCSDFVAHVKALLKRSVSVPDELSSRAHIDSQLGAINDITDRENYNGKDNKHLSKTLQGQLNRTYKKFTQEGTLSFPNSNQKKTQKVESFQRVKKPPVNFAKYPPKKIDERLGESSSSSNKFDCISSCNSEDITKNYTYKNNLKCYCDDLIQQMTKVVPKLLSNENKLKSELLSLKNYCPDKLTSEFEFFVNGIEDPFYRKIYQLSCRAPIELQDHFENFLQKVSYQSKNPMSLNSSHKSDLIRLLKLDEKDLSVINDYGIDLIKLWNSEAL
jgi:hypothetical protein